MADKKEVKSAVTHAGVGAVAGVVAAAAVGSIVGAPVVAAGAVVGLAAYGLGKVYRS